MARTRRHRAAFLASATIPRRRAAHPAVCAPHQTAPPRHPHKRARTHGPRISCKAAAPPGAAPLPPPPPVPSSASAQALAVSQLRVRRYLVFAAMGISYATYVGLRSTFPFAAPTLGLSLRAVGAVSSAFPVTYGLSRLLTGALVDNGSPRVVLLCGLALAGAAVALMAAVPPAAAPLAVLWALHGLVQGAGAGASAKLLTAWFAPSERGRWWALWATSANAGAFAAPLAVSAIAASAGARAALAASGVAAIAVAALAAPLLCDSPARAAYAVPWAPRIDSAPDERAGKGGGGGGGGGGFRAYWEALKRGVFQNRALWALALANASIYLVRSGLKNWLHFFLIATRGVSPATAAVRASVAELGGVAGTFGAGLISDMAGGRRVPVTVVYLVFLAVSLLALGAAPAGSPLFDGALIAAVGFGVNGPQMMIGLIGAEIVDPRVMATAAGVLGFISYAGAAAAGYPLSAVVAAGGWAPFFSVLAVAAAIAAALLVPFWRSGGAPRE